MKNDSINIIVADDHTIFLEGLVSLLQNCDGINIIATASNGQEVLDVLKQTKPQLLILDINMPDMNGIELCSHIQKLYPLIPILALTMHDEQKIIANMLKAGAKGYILKNTHRDELLEAIRTVALGKIYISNGVKSKMESESSLKKRETSFIPKLSQREKEILQLVAKELTAQEIADKLFISHHTVISHRKKLLFKFNVQNSAGLIKRAAESGMLD